MKPRNLECEQTMKMRKKLKDPATEAPVQPGASAPSSEQKAPVESEARLTELFSGKDGEAGKSPLRRSWSARGEKPKQAEATLDDTLSLVRSVTEIISAQEEFYPGQTEQRGKKVGSARMLQSASEARESSPHETRVDLSRFDDKPFVPPAADPTLEELFGPTAAEMPGEEARSAENSGAEAVSRGREGDKSTVPVSAAEEAAPEAGNEGPAPAGSEITGPLPTLEELFGPETVLAAAANLMPKPQAEPAKKHRKLRELLPNRRAQEENPSAGAELVPQAVKEPSAAEAPRSEEQGAEPKTEQNSQRSEPQQSGRCGQQSLFRAEPLPHRAQGPQSQEASQSAQAVQAEEAAQSKKAAQGEESLPTEKAPLLNVRKIHRFFRDVLMDLGAVFREKQDETAELPPVQAVPAENGAVPEEKGDKSAAAKAPGKASEPNAAGEGKALPAEAVPAESALAEAAPGESAPAEAEPEGGSSAEGKRGPEKSPLSPEVTAVAAAATLNRNTVPASTAAALETQTKKNNPPAPEAGKSEAKCETADTPAAARKKGKKKKKKQGAAPERTETAVEDVFRGEPQKKQSEAPKSAEPVVSASVRPQANGKGGNARQPEAFSGGAELPEELFPVQARAEEVYRFFAKPLDSISVRLILTGLLTLLSLFFTLYLSQNWSFLPQFFASGTTVYVLLILLLGMVLVNYRLYFLQWRGKHGLRVELLIGIATLFTALDCVNAAKTLRAPYPVVVGILLLIELWGSYDRGLGMLTTLKVLREENLAAGVSEVPEISKGQRGLVRSEPDLEAFLEKLQTQNLVDKAMSIYTPIALAVGLLLTLFITLQLKQDPFWSGSLIFLGSVPVMGLLAYPRLFYQLAERLSAANAALCGYHGAEVFGGEHSILIGDEDVFPKGALSLNGFKVYNGNPTYVIALAAAAFRKSGSALDPVFEDLLVTHNGRRFQVDNFRFYDSGGIGASIRQDVVLLGSLEFMRRMGVHMDRGVKVKQAVYMSLNGELAAVFAVRYLPPENLCKGLSAIAGNRHFKGILVTRTFLGTPGFFKAKFGIPSSAFLYPGTMERVRLSESEIKRSGPQGAILARDSFSGFAQAAAGGRMLCSATLGAAILSVLGGAGGLLLMGVLAALPAYETATALNVAFYISAWLAPTLLLTAWGRHF